jgi:pimeloyl-ACP methyl ester carboxylesterase
MTGTIVKVTTKDNLILHGLFSKVAGDSIVLHIHGFEGNFYENYFLTPISDKLAKNNISFLSVNTRGNGKLSDITTVDGQTTLVGAWNEKLGDSIMDMDAWITFLQKEGFKTIILEGHSLGTRKTTRYIYEGTFRNIISKLILLSPFDALGNLGPAVKNLSFLLVAAKQEMDAGNGTANAKISPWMGMSFQTFYSWYQQTDINRIFEFCNSTYDFPSLRGLPVPTLTIVGEKDSYFHPTNPTNPQKAIDIISSHIPSGSTHLISGADHWFHGFETQIADTIFSFVNEQDA